MGGMLKYLEKLPKQYMLFISVIMIVLLGVMDYFSGPDLSVFIFYLAPVFLATWFISRATGVALSVLSALSWSLADRIYANAIIPYWNLSMEVGFFVIITYILSGLKDSLEMEKQMARTDQLTGAVNRRYFMELAEMEIIRMRRYVRPFTAAYLDVDNFKRINDTLGHQAGDALLQLVVKTMRNDTRATDIIARIGGDEFMVLLPETDFETAQAAMNKIRFRLMAAVVGSDFPVTFSFGVVTFLEPPRSIDHLINLADSLMYRGKNSGKDRIVHEKYTGEKRMAAQRHEYIR